MVNSGNANAFTGKAGREAAKLTAEITAAAAECRPDEVFLASTGVIGEPLDARKFGRRDGPSGPVGARAGQWHAAAKAIMTTDTFPKGAAAVVRLGNVPVTICGIAKGAGMIAPDMGTMLAFVFTDAPIAQPVLQSLVARGVEDTFNAVTIDGDTSTSDTLLAFATGAAAARGVPKIARPGDARLAPFRKAFNAVLANLAEQVARDGEGARKLVEVIVEGAASKRAARRVALSIANSPLVKTAIAGEDANWGRVVMAVGKAGERGRSRQAVDLVRRHPRRPQGRARSRLRRSRGLADDEAPGNRTQGQSRTRQGPRPGAHLRPHQGLCGDQRRLSKLSIMTSSWIAPLSVVMPRGGGASSNHGRVVFTGSPASAGDDEASARLRGAA